MSMFERIQTQLNRHLAPLHMELVDESSQHNVPAGSESHWKLIIVSAEFQGKRAVQRHRAVYRALGDELRGGIHALTMKTLDPIEWEASNGQASLTSPQCLGGSKHDH